VIFAARRSGRLRNKKATPVESMAEVDARPLVHELQVHQIELEMQNEELQRARAEAEEALEKYYDLFDFAPVGALPVGPRWADSEGQFLRGPALLACTAAWWSTSGSANLWLRNTGLRSPTSVSGCRWPIRSKSCEVKILKSGLAVDVVVEGIAAQDRERQQTLCRAAVIDITQQKRADELAAANQALEAEIAARKRAEEEVRSLAEFPEENPNPILRATGDGPVLYANQPALRLMEAMGWQAGHPLPEELLRPVRRVLETGEKQEFDLLCPSGRTFSFAMAPSSHVGQANLYARDITDRKRAEETLRRSEEWYRTLFNTLIEGFCIIEVVFDAEGKPVDYRFLEINPAFERQTGLHDAQGKLMRGLAPDHEAHWFEKLWKNRADGRNRRALRTRPRR